ncbi:type II toxin-antitoxin system VapC family toxin [Massilia sp. W12]|uniref:type II toxin-antitoxin system VapC family toxin n=1 Tax=Massilia sp. W12 TaxID=3126507 RepID=UPI0030D4562A
MILLDTNVLSELMRPQPEQKVLQWIDTQAPSRLRISSLTVAEISLGIARLPDGKRKENFTRLAQALFEEDFAGKILPFDTAAAHHYAQIVAQREKAGRPISMADAQIAAICQNIPGPAALATRNVKDFAGLDIALINPWE